MKKLTNETKYRILENNLTISNLLNRNEELYLEELNDFERRVLGVKDFRIQVPANYIRPLSHFIKAYNLENITRNIQHQENIAYLMQYNDLLHFFYTRFKYEEDLEKVHYYYEMINLGSILEIIIKEVADSYRKICIKCENKKKRTCCYKINKNDMFDLKLLITRLSNLRIINPTNENLDRLLSLVDLRNNIHLRLIKNTFYNTTNYSRDYYNEYMYAFRQLIDSIDFKNISCKND